MQLSPLVAQNDTEQADHLEVLAVPALRAKYLGFVRESRRSRSTGTPFGPVVKQYRELIAADVARDTRKLFSTDEFLARHGGRRRPGTLRGFFEARRAFLLNWMAENAAPPAAR